MHIRTWAKLSQLTTSLLLWDERQWVVAYSGPALRWAAT